ncbi:MAG: hypothetical protein EPO02_13140 [Nitrospirae bacterium]|nr:MAG: hypothetical protein EPO02_13140 [Nitrospirota bacterium]
MNAIKSAATGRMGRGAGWREALKKTYGGKNLGMAEQDKSRQMQGRLATARAVGGAHDTPFPAPEHVGWRTCCAMNFDNRTRPGVVLDPFAGAGTTLMAAERLGRRAIGIELNGDYICMARERIGRAIKRNTEQANRVYSEQ